MIWTVLMRDGIDRALAKKVSVWPWKQGQREFYVFHADR